MVQLDQQQMNAVLAQSRRVLVLAGAGSGKTRVLIERIAHLIEHEKVSPYEVMSFSFSRKAAGEIRERLIERIGNKAHHIQMGTMHALALRMINRFGDVIGLRAKDAVTVYSQWEEDYLLQEVARDMGIYNGKAWKTPKREVEAMFADYYQRGIEPGDDNPARDLFKAFIARCRENNALTYGGLLTGLRLLIPTLAKFLHIKHILVDEVQDLDALQWQIVNEMCSAFGASLYIVGDVSQSIYAWRGAVPSYLVEHQDDFSIYNLESNYRSLPTVVTAANRLIENNSMRLPLNMRATREA